MPAVNDYVYMQPIFRLWSG